MRGKAEFQQPSVHLQRITPACAGKRKSDSCLRPAARDHPRMCGEKRFNRDQTILTTGSPPHVRGKEYLPRLVCPRKGITPACAGKRKSDSCLRPAARDHPRMCGEKRFNRDQTILTTGSPPHVRGKVPLTIECGFCAGITPACAGKRKWIR